MKIWQGYPGHFCCADHCLFRMCTAVGPGKILWVVSTVGDMRDKNGDVENIGSKRKYETKIFSAEKCKCGCGGYTVKDLSEVDSLSYNTAKKAREGHMKLCRKWERISTLKKKEG